MKNVFNLTIIFFALILSNSCVKDSPSDPCQENQTLPEVTTSGKNTFGCLINGEPWVAYTDRTDAILGGEKRLDVDFDQSGKYAFIIANKTIQKENCATTQQTFTLHINDVMQGVSNHFGSNSNFFDFQAGCGYETDTLAENEVIITKLDTENSILSCTFKFQLISENCVDTIRITEGRFDSTYGF